MIIRRHIPANESFVEHKITIITMHKPRVSDVNKELQWFGSSLGLFGLRDKDSSCFRVFIELLKARKMRSPLSSDEIAERTSLSRGTVIHHINRLMDSGIIIVIRNKYMLRSDNLKELISELKRDTESAWNNLQNIADEIDSKLGL
ncbi:MAG: helix-turn-helix domain-containing protein [Candidatus Woesearchaeota archaeon]|jgi:predicted transcriptional regulator